MLTEGQIKAHVRSIRSKTTHKPLAYALRSERPWSGAPQVTIDGEPHRVAFCRSGLELRELLRVAKSDNQPLIALCPFGADRLEDDVIARLAKRRIHAPDTREALANLFQVSAIDPRVFAARALVQALVENAPVDGYPVIASGVLDLQSAWSAFAERVLGDAAMASSVNRMLELSLDPVGARRLETTSSDLRREFFIWASSAVDPSFGWIAHLIEAGKTSDLVPLGLLLDVLFQPGAGATPAVSAAKVRLESWFSGHGLDEGSAKSWVAAARSVFATIQGRPDRSNTAAQVLSRLDGLLAEFKVADLATRSDFSPSGFEQRVRVFARHLEACVAPGSSTLDLKAAVQSLDALRGHALTPAHRRRIEQCEMATRLASWINDGASLPAAGGFEEYVAGYVRIGGFVDWARTVVEEGDSDPALSRAHQAVLARARQACDGFEASFAAKLVEWTRLASVQAPGFLPVEEALEKIVGPVAAQAPVLFLVMDGMSVPIFRELISDVVQRGKWLETRPRNVPVPTALLATVPSVTEVSRRALLRGKLHPESIPTEQSAFSGNDRLFSQSGSQVRPVLFLKGDLQVSGEVGLPSTVKAAIGNKRCRVIGMVLNAIDDQLSGSDQIAQKWDLDYVRVLRDVLVVAAEAGRTLIVTSDHGHVLDHGTTFQAGMSVGGDRYRHDGGPPRDGEIVVGGPRVKDALGREAITAAWSRGIRYSTKKTGYHGGLNPQEMVIPIAVLRHMNNAAPDGWQDVSPSPYWPSWWRLSTEVIGVASTEAETKLVASLDLFAHATATAQATGWIDELLKSDVYAAQSSLAARGAPDPKLAATFLEALSSRGGTMPRETLAERLGLPLNRINGVVFNLARVFNVDGYDVLKIDTGSGTVVLNVALLKQQFEIER